MAIVIITHDLGVVAEMADDVAVMYAGRIVETASAEVVFNNPEHPYTWGLLKSIPVLGESREEELVPISGTPPSLIRRPSGCHFHPRCPYAKPRHAEVDPQLEPVSARPEHHAACLLDSGVRQRLWEELQQGRTPDEAIAGAGLTDTAGLAGFTASAPGARPPGEAEPAGEPDLAGGPAW